jgi:hypothetical protein
MSAVHDAIATAALSVQPKKIQDIFIPFIEDLKTSAWYPDYFADRSMSKKDKDKIDPEADKFIYPLPPKNQTQKRFEAIAESQTYTDASPFHQAYLVGHYLKNAVKSLKNGDIKSSIKFCGVYSHVIADTCEPIHALSPFILDITAPPPSRHIGTELHANVEGLKAPVNISRHKPKLLGGSLKQAEMSAFSALIKSHQFGASMATPIVQALYAGRKKEAVALSGKAQSESAKHFADFIYTVFHLAESKGSQKKSSTLDLRTYPPVETKVDMLYRYKPLADVALIPYSGGKSCKLEIIDKSGNRKKVKGLGVVPFLGPPFTKDILRDAWMEYYLEPGAYQKFKAKVGLHPAFPEATPSVIFSVELDGKEAARTKPLKRMEPAALLEADLGNARWLKLKIRYHRNPSKKDLATVKKLCWIGHCVWAEPQLI